MLDDTAQELSGVEWSINDPSLATLSEQDGRITWVAMKAGTSPLPLPYPIARTIRRAAQPLPLLRLGPKRPGHNNPVFSQVLPAGRFR